MSVRVASCKRRCIENPSASLRAGFLFTRMLLYTNFLVPQKFTRSDIHKKSLAESNRWSYNKTKKPATPCDRSILNLFMLSLRQLQVMIVPNQ